MGSSGTFAKEPYCIMFVELCESRVSQDNLPFLGPFQLACNLWLVKVCLLDGYLSRDLIYVLRSVMITLDMMNITSMR
ncbi:hypothetical protein HPB52_018596 [Rhipicephalus sanguineus]|uniref:Uncharacterized protein n=1 Tax=Rhipicephalus sanguineus TaxID=34632 RepID=A0A9D4TB69_RHISA|nr:hypothetical protein HPB52_018596 [Rhipicephalus sanguineus]